MALPTPSHGVTVSTHAADVAFSSGAYILCIVAGPTLSSPDTGESALPRTARDGKLLNAQPSEPRPLAEQPLAANTLEGNQDLRLQEDLRRDRLATPVRVQFIEPGFESTDCLVRDLLHESDRVIPRNELFRGHCIDQLGLLLDVSARIRKVQGSGRFVNGRKPILSAAC